ncbi:MULTISPECIES: RNA-binding domain-containing protein [unclassified Corynebacterium]|uniref:RNA-binding domain-containing protein n=1 Tax=unclassified Corynebacterium TaxID=2624378 RepID=UPI001EF42FF0|nr:MULTISPECIES: RNA-binding domain-containing protein [unclassified Corynebacterium]MCG7289740.1 putative DNA binding domain-containing protein [Corynebacterium sp. ACRPZ]MCG7293922.1 putative DNA binding domain-containing protein [Corynebacterium sp. ACRPY]
MTWTEGQLRETLSQLRAFGDDPTLVECKTAGGGVPKNIGETLCAFANMPQSGAILLGVSERRGFEVTGVDDPAQMEKKVTSVNRAAVKPAPQLEFTHLSLEGKNVVVVEVTPLLPSEKPANYDGKPYLRQADGDYVMNSNDLKMLELSALAERQQAHFDFESVPGTDADVLDGEVLTGYLKAVRGSRSRISKIDDDAQLLQVTNVTNSEGNVRFGGLYALGFLPQSVEPALGATAAVRLSRGEGVGRNRNLTEIEGPLPVMLTEAMEWIQQNSDTVSRYTNSGHLVDEPEFPPSAIREVLANALVHRDLGPSVDVGKKVEIRITERMLIVVSPGGLRGLSVSQLESPVLTKSPVNKRLYEIARYLRTEDGERVIEGEGGGIQEILAATREARLPKPRFIDNGVEFKVLFPRGSRFTEEQNTWLKGLQSGGEQFTPTEEDLLVELQNHGATSFQAITQRYTPLGEQACRNMLRKLVNAGAIVESDGVFSLSGESPRQHSDFTARAESLAALGKNVPAVYQAIPPAGAVTLKELQATTGLSPAQLRYALEPLLDHAHVVMLGGQGQRTTTYRRT